MIYVQSGKYRKASYELRISMMENLGMKNFTCELKYLLYRDMFPYMFNVLLTHNNNFVIVSLAWGQF